MHLRVKRQNFLKVALNSLNSLKGMKALKSACLYDTGLPFDSFKDGKCIQSKMCMKDVVQIQGFIEKCM